MLFGRTSLMTGSPRIGNVQAWLLSSLLWIPTGAVAQEPTEGPSVFVLEGVIVATNPADSVALIHLKGAARARVLRVGEAFLDYVLATVDKSSVRLESARADVRLYMNGTPPEVHERSTAESERLAGESPPDTGENDDDGWIRRAIPRMEAQVRLREEMPVILRETDFEPRVEDGEVRGLSVARLPDGTLLSECGLLPGDVLVSVNEEPLRGVDSLWELLSRLLDEREIRVVVRRQGEVLKLAYALTN
jgi:type II secretion system protein C